MSDPNGGDHDGDGDQDGFSRQQRIALVLGGAILAIAVAGLVTAALGYTWHIGPGVTVHQESGPTVTIDETVNTTSAQPTPDGNTVDLSPEVVFYSNGSTNVRLERLGHTEDDWTNLTQLDVATTDLRVNPEGSQRVTVGGDVDSLRFRQVSLADSDDDRADLAYDGGATTVTIEDLDTGVRLEAVNLATGETLDLTSVSSDGTATLSLPSGSSLRHVSIRADDANPPVISNPSPPDGATVEDSATLEVNVSDSDFQFGHNVSVTIYGNGNQLHQENISSNSTVSTTWDNIEGGHNTWTVEATDAFGSTSTETYDLHASVLLYVHDGAAENHTLMSQDVEAELISTEDDSNYVETRTISNGAIRLGGVPDEQLLVRLNSSGYNPRELIITEPYGMQTRRTLLHDSANDQAFSQCFSLDSRASGFAPENTWLIAQMYLEGEWRDAAGGYFGTANQRCLGLEDNEQYRLVVEQTDDRRSLGGYTADIGLSDQITPLVVEGVELSLERGSTYQWEVQAKANRTDSDELEGGDIVFKFDSGDRDVKNLEITITNQSDPSHQIQYDILDGEVGTYVASYPVPEEHLNTTWVVEWSATIDGQQQTGSESVSLAYGNGSLGLGEMWTKIAVAGLLVLMAGIFGMVHAPAGAVVVAATAAIFNVMNLIDLPTLLVSTTLAIAILGFVAAKTRGGL